MSALLEYHPATRTPPGVAVMLGYREEGLTPGSHIGVPSPYLTFIFSTDGLLEVSEQADLRLTTSAGVLIGGLHSRPAYVVQPERQSGIQLAVHPLAARALFGAPARELSSIATDGTDVLGAGVEQIRQRLREPVGWAASFAAVHEYLAYRWRNHAGQRPRAEVAEAWRMMSRRRGVATMPQVAAHVGISHRQLRSLFQQEVGMGPKAVCRLLRFQHAKDLVVGQVAMAGGSLTQVAYTCGYADQSHLVRDFQQYIGLSPTQWLSSERQIVQASATAEDA